jgi:transcriptional regulator with XRE-family HTH domain
VSDPWEIRRTALRQAFKELRLKAKLTQIDVAHGLNKPQSYVSKYENGERKLDYVEVIELCDLFGVSISQLDKRYRNNLQNL